MVPRKESQPRSSTACKELGILQRPHKSTQRFILSILNPVCDREPIFCISVFPLVCQVPIFTTEYSMRTGMEAVYTLLDIDRGVPEVWGSVYDIRDLLNATIQLRDGKPLTEMNLGFKEKMVVKKLLEKIRGTDIEKLLKEYHVIE